MNIDAIPLESFRLIAASIEKEVYTAHEEWNAYRDSHKLKVAAEKERIAYLHGVLYGLCQAMREFEKKCPLEFYGSDIQHGE